MDKKYKFVNYAKVKGMNFLWGKWLGRFRWLYWEWGETNYPLPKIEKYRHGIRFCWLKLGIGVGIVTDGLMAEIEAQ